jgi:hypothetical protein
VIDFGFIVAFAERGSIKTHEINRVCGKKFVGAVRSQESGVRSQESGVRSREPVVSGFVALVPIYVLEEG